jgi:cytochrome c5
MKKDVWLIALAALLIFSAGCTKTDTPPAAAAVEKPAGRATLTGEQIYAETCSACHATGVAGAPIVGDKAAWAPHIAEGIDHLVEVAIAGEGAMPPRGGRADLSDGEVRAAVQYMLNQVR